MDDQSVIRSEAASVTGLAYPLIKKHPSGACEIYDVVMVSSYRQVPDGRWTVDHSQLTRCVDEDVWLPQPSSDKEYAEFDRRTTFTSLRAAVEAARARQEQIQAEYDAEGKS